MVRGGHVQTYTPDETRNAESYIKAKARTLFFKPYECSVHLEVTYFLYRHVKTITRGPRKGLEVITVPRRIDTDNVLKLVKDALSEIVYINDFQVTKDMCQYFFVSDKALERTVINVVTDDVEEIDT